MKVSRYIFLTFLLSLTSLPLLAQVNDTYVIPAAANASGAFGTRWMTRFSVSNPQNYSLKISVVFLPTGGGKGQEVLFTVPSNSVFFTDNALEDLFNTSGTGALLVATFPEDNPGVPDNAVARSFLVNTNTFNDSRGGTFGQTIPGIWTGLQDFATDGISSIAHGIRNIDRQGWRTNVGAVNLGRSSVTLKMTVFDIHGNTILSNANFSIPPMGHIQDRLPIEVDRGSIEFILDDPSKQAVVFPYTSTIDVLSGDPEYQTPVLLASARVIFPKGALAPVSPQAVGKRIDTQMAREVRATAVRKGEASVVSAGQGYQLQRLQ